MESSRAGRKLSDSCQWDQNGNSLFRRSWVMAIAARARTSAPARLSFLRWSCSPFRARTNQKLRQNSAAEELGVSLGCDKPLIRKASPTPGLLLEAIRERRLALRDHRQILKTSVRPALCETRSAGVWHIVAWPAESLPALLPMQVAP